MAITPLTGFKSFTFGDVVSTDYGVQILGEGVFNAPERVVEMIEIPGRNGAFALDKGRFENIEVTYPATLIADNVEDFAEALSDLRNALCSKRGYMRLEDDYHPDEYRMAVYKEGLEVDEEVLRVGKFNIKFDCKPQRFLTSGETAVSVTSGDTLTNPTLFDSSPLLHVYGRGGISINGENITVVASPIGNTIALNSQTYSSSTAQIAMPDTFVNGDTFTVSGATFTQRTTLSDTSWYTSRILNNYTLISNLSGMSSSTGSSNAWDVTLRLANISFVYGTSSTVTASGSVRFNYRLTSTGEWQTSTQTFSMAVTYNATAGTITYTGSQVDEPTGCVASSDYEIKTGEISGFSNKVLNDPLYIDLDVGEAYKIISSEIVSYNSAVTLPSALPKLVSGANEITFDNTVTDLKVLPRWWKI